MNDFIGKFPDKFARMLEQKGMNILFDLDLEGEWQKGSTMVIGSLKRLAILVENMWGRMKAIFSENGQKRIF
jgi:hypothetical protein